MDQADISTLKALASKALMEMIANGKLGGGDLIKLLTLVSPGEEADLPGQDFVIRLVDQ